MRLASFLTALLETGRVRAPLPDEWSEDEVCASDAVLRGFERHYRTEMPGTPPSLDLAAARWAAVQFSRACQFAIYRDVPPELINQELSRPGPTANTPAVHYSVDLVFRLLPDLVRFSRSAAEGDPLIHHLLQWAQQWPLSSVGIPGVEPVGVMGFAADPSLLTLYVDRILAARDLNRLGDECVRNAARRALGLHTELAPEVAATLIKGASARTFRGDP